MVTLFHDMMHKEIEVYMDNMITKSKSKDDHILNCSKAYGSLNSD